MKTYRGLYVVAGGIRRLTFEALDVADATAIAARWGVGVEGEANTTLPQDAVIPEAYNLATACRLLGGVSRGTIYRWLHLERLERVPDTARVLITRKSLERCAAGL